MVITSPSHTQSHKSRDKPICYSIRLLPRHFDQTQQLLHTDVQHPLFPIFTSESRCLEHGNRLSGFSVIVEQLDFCENVFQGSDVRDGWHRKFGIKVLREPEVGENRTGRRGGDDEATALESGISQRIPSAVKFSPLAVAGQTGPREPEEQSWRTWVRSASNLGTCGYLEFNEGKKCYGYQAIASSCL